MDKLDKFAFQTIGKLESSQIYERLVWWYVANFIFVHAAQL